MHSDHNIFVRAIKKKKKLKVTFRSTPDGNELIVECAPMDYHPCRRASDQSDSYYFWCSDTELYSFEPDKNHRLLKLPPHQIISIRPTPDAFDPAEFSHLNINWFLPPKHWHHNKLFILLKHLFTKKNKDRPADRRTPHQPVGQNLLRH